MNARYWIVSLLGCGLMACGSAEMVGEDAAGPPTEAPQASAMHVPSTEETPVTENADPAGPVPLSLLLDQYHAPGTYILSPAEAQMPPRHRVDANGDLIGVYGVPYDPCDERPCP